MKFKRAAEVLPVSESSLVKALGKSRFAKDLKGRLKENSSVIPLSPKLSAAVVEVLVAECQNAQALMRVVGGLVRLPTGRIQNLQFDAIQMAMRAFGLPADSIALSLDIVKGSATALSTARVYEDAVIEHDAREVPGYSLTESVTGRATFRNGSELLEVLTANRNSLEEAFGVDLIYLNQSQENVVMVQYKMLEASGKGGDWVYRKDRHLAKQLQTMGLFRMRPRSKPVPYRLNPEVFFFKFVRRVGQDSSGNVLMPFDQFTDVLGSPDHQGKGRALKMSFELLAGNYLKQSDFFGLLQSGYIGADASTFADLKELINAVGAGDDALVIAVQREITEAEHNSDFQRIERFYAAKDGVTFE